MTYKKDFFLYNRLLAKKNILKFFGKILSAYFSTGNNISKFCENRRQKSSAGVGGLKNLFWQVFFLLILAIEIRSASFSFQY